MNRTRKSARLLFFVVLVLLFVAGMVMIVQHARMTRRTEPGRLVYERSCAPCHGISGNGVGTLYPPLNTSPFFSKKISDLPCLIRTGVTGDIRLANGSYNLLMPPFPHLSSNELAELLSFLHIRWGGGKQTIPDPDIETWLSNCGS